MSFLIPSVPVSCGCLLFDEAGRLLVLKPTYKKGWTIPGGIMEDDGETPWDGCRREVREETGLEVTAGRLVAVDTRPSKADGRTGLRFLFRAVHPLTAADVAAIGLQEDEASEHRFVTRQEARKLLRPAIATPHANVTESRRLTTGGGYQRRSSRTASSMRRSWVTSSRAPS